MGGLGEHGSGDMFLAFSCAEQTLDVGYGGLPESAKSQLEALSNTYINELRINHFIGLYREAVSAGRPVSAKLLAGRSGYRSYSTFSLAFKQYTGFSVTNWIYKESLISSVGASAATP
jgi:AraC-like DNA-binding protein